MPVPTYGASTAPHSPIPSAGGAEKHPARHRPTKRPLTANLVPLVVECKQYAKPKNKSFADTLTDYAHGHPAARVVLVNYGPGQETTITNRVADDVRNRTTFIPEVHPGNPHALRRFRQEIRSAVGLSPSTDDADTSP